MSNTWILYLVTYALTGNPLVALLAVGVFVWFGEGWWRGRLWKPWVIVQQWMRIRELRGHVLLAPHDLTARADLGRLLVERGAPAEAIPHLEAVVAKLPNLAFPAYHLGLARLATGDFDGGKSAIDAALANRKDLDAGRPQLALGDFVAARGKWTEALAFYERAEAANASSVEILYKVGTARLACADAAGAARAFREAEAVYASAPGFKQRTERAWAWRAWWAARSASKAASPA